MRPCSPFNMSPRLLALRGLVALLIFTIMLASASRANDFDFPEYPGELTEPEKSSLASWGIIGQYTAWCVCQKVGPVSIHFSAPLTALLVTQPTSFLFASLRRPITPGCNSCRYIFSPTSFSTRPQFPMSCCSGSASELESRKLVCPCLADANSPRRRCHLRCS